MNSDGQRGGQVPTPSGDDCGPWWRVVAREPLLREPFVDWFRAETEAGARQLWAEDAHRYGLPASVAITEVRRATPEESAAVAACA